MPAFSTRSEGMILSGNLLPFKIFLLLLFFPQALGAQISNDFFEQAAIRITSFNDNTPYIATTNEGLMLKYGRGPDDGMTFGGAVEAIFPLHSDFTDQIYLKTMLNSYTHNAWFSNKYEAYFFDLERFRYDILTSTIAIEKKLDVLTLILGIDHVNLGHSFGDGIQTWFHKTIGVPPPDSLPYVNESVSTLGVILGLQYPLYDIDLGSVRLFGSGNFRGSLDCFRSLKDQFQLVSHNLISSGLFGLKIDTGFKFYNLIEKKYQSEAFSSGIFVNLTLRIKVGIATLEMGESFKAFGSQSLNSSVEDFDHQYTLALTLGAEKELDPLPVFYP